MSESAIVLLNLFIMFAAAKVAGEIFERLRQPMVIGELLAGIALGSFGLIHASPVFDAIAEIGAIVLLFHVGLETRLSSIMRVGGIAMLVATLGVIVPFFLGLAWILAQGGSLNVALFMGAAMVATSVGITARVLSDKGLLQARESKVILGAAVIDDVLGLLVLALVSGMGQGQLSLTNLALLLVEAVIFTAFIAIVGTHATRRFGSLLQHLNIRNAPLAVAIVVTLGLATLSTFIGLAAIVGAFLAGMIFAETKDQYALEHQVEPLYDFLVPFFFVVLGSKVDLSLFVGEGLIGEALVVTALAIVGKLVGCGLGALPLGRPGAAIVGVGMIPRGEVGMIVAAVGLRLAIIDQSLYGVVIFMVIVTTLLAPFLLQPLFAYQRRLEASRPYARQKASPSTGVVTRPTDRRKIE